MTSNDRFLLVNSKSHKQSSSSQILVVNIIIETAILCKEAVLNFVGDYLNVCSVNSRKFVLPAFCDVDLFGTEKVCIFW